MSAHTEDIFRVGVETPAVAVDPNYPRYNEMFLKNPVGFTIHKVGKKKLTFLFDADIFGVRVTPEEGGHDVLLTYRALASFRRGQSSPFGGPEKSAHKKYRKYLRGLVGVSHSLSYRDMHKSFYEQFGVGVKTIVKIAWKVYLEGFRKLPKPVRNATYTYFRTGRFPVSGVSNRSLWEAVLRLGEDGLCNLTPLVLRYCIEHPEPVKKLREEFGKGTWKVVSKKSLGFNTALARLIGALPMSHFATSVEPWQVNQWISKGLLKRSFVSLVSTYHHNRNELMDTIANHQELLRIPATWWARSREGREASLLSFSPSSVSLFRDTFMRDVKFDCGEAFVNREFKKFLKTIRGIKRNEFQKFYTALETYHDTLTDRQRVVLRARRILRGDDYLSLSASELKFKDKLGGLNLGSVEMDGYKVTHLTSPEELLKEGEDMRHCVASYATQVVSGTSYIFSITKGDFRSTLEVVLNLSMEGFSARENQHYKKHNAGLTEEECEACAEVVRYLIKQVTNHAETNGKPLLEELREEVQRHVEEVRNAREQLAMAQ